MSSQLPSSFIPVQRQNQLAPKHNQYSNLPSSFKPFTEADRQVQQKESSLKSLARTALQIPTGLAKALPLSYGLDLLKAATSGASQEVLRDISENDPNIIPEIAEQARQRSLSYFPTQELAEQLIEKKIGLPLEPKSKLQKNLRLASSAAAFRPGGVAAKGTAAVAAPVISQSAQGLGLPEGASQTLGLLGSGGVPSPKTVKASHPSGLTKRRFENVEKPTKVSASRHSKITAAVEKDFKGVADQLLEKNPTYRSIRDDTQFKDKVTDLFGKVEELSEQVPGEINSQEVNKALRKRFSNREKKGVTEDEYEKAFRKDVKKISDTFSFEDFTPKQFVDQFRKNNKSLKELFEPGKSSAQNRAKREALLEYNRAIEDVFKSKYPDSEFQKLFEFTNKRWSEISDVEQIDKFMNDAFSGKINYGKVKQLLNRDKAHVSTPFKRILGEETFNDFKGLVNDLMTSEQAMSNIKKASAEGFGDIGKNFVGFLVHPNFAKVKLALKYGQDAFKTLLDKPQLITTWHRGLVNFKSGNYAKADEDFKKLDKELTTQGNPQKTTK